MLSAHGGVPDPSPADPRNSQMTNDPSVLHSKAVKPTLAAPYTISLISLHKLKEDQHRILMFSQMVCLPDIMSDYMMLCWTVSSKLQRKTIEHFNAPGSTDFAFLLSTCAGSLGINFKTAKTVIILTRICYGSRASY